MKLDVKYALKQAIGISMKSFQSRGVLKGFDVLAENVTWICTIGYYVFETHVFSMSVKLHAF